MATNLMSTPASVRSSSASDDLLLRETNHRCSNDLQLVVSLLALQSRRAGTPEVRQALGDAMERVSILARSRSMMHDGQQSLDTALRQVCEALHAQAEPRLIDVIFETEGEVQAISAGRITTLALVVNELATNAIKHAFEESRGGRIMVSLGASQRAVTVKVDDDGLPFPELDSTGTGLGMGLVERMMASIDGLLIPPPPGSKLFQLRVPNV